MIMFNILFAAINMQHMPLTLNSTAQLALQGEAFM